MLAALRACGLTAGHAALAAGPSDASTGLAQAAATGSSADRPASGCELPLPQGGPSVDHPPFRDWVQGQIAGIDSSIQAISGALMASVTDTHAGTSGSVNTKRGTPLPSFAAAADKRDITVRQAFRHTSGPAGDQAGSDSIREAVNLQTAAALISAQPVDNSPPGSTSAHVALSMQATGAGPR